MSKRWQLQEAKNRLSRVVADARARGPQTITVHGKDNAVVLSVDEYRKLIRPRGSLVEFFRDSPLRGTPIRAVRTGDKGRARVRF